MYDQNCINNIIYCTKIFRLITLNSIDYYQCIVKNIGEIKDSNYPFRNSIHVKRNHIKVADNYGYNYSPEFDLNDKNFRKRIENYKTLIPFY